MERMGLAILSRNDSSPLASICRDSTKSRLTGRVSVSVSCRQTAGTSPSLSAPLSLAEHKALLLALRDCPSPSLEASRKPLLLLQDRKEGRRKSPSFALKAQRGGTLLHLHKALCTLRDSPSLSLEGKALALVLLCFKTCTLSPSCFQAGRQKDKKTR